MREWWQRWAAVPGELRQRWRSADQRQRFRRGLVLRAILLLILIWIAWPLALFVAVILAAQYGRPYVPPRFAWVNRVAVPTIVLIVAITYPFYRDSLPEMNLFGQFPSMETAVIMGVFAIMAVGLNIVVGYAGLLDLGYVAFYAMGAYTVAWFASVQFAGENVRFGAVGVGENTPGIHISIWHPARRRRIFTALIGVIIGLPTLRLRGDYLAIVTLGFGEILPQVARNGDNLFGFNVTNGPNGITPIDSPGFGNLNYLTGSGSFWTSGRLFFWGARPRRVHRVLQPAAARLSTRPRVDRDPRGRDGRCGDGRAAHAHQDMGLCDRRVLRRHRGGVLRELQELDVPQRLQLQHLGVHPLDGHPRRNGQCVGRDLRRRLPRLSQPAKGSRTSARR